MKIEWMFTKQGKTYKNNGFLMKLHCIFLLLLFLYIRHYYWFSYEIIITTYHSFTSRFCP